MKVVFVTSQSTIDHSSTMIDELQKHIGLCVVLVAKTQTDEIKTFCRLHNAVFFSRKRFSNPLGIFSEIKLLLYIIKQKPDLVWFNTFTLWQSVLAKLFISKPLIVNAHDVEFHPEDKNFHGRLSQKITFKLYRKSVAVMSKTQAELFNKKYGRYPFVLQLPIIDYYEKTAAQSIRKTGKGGGESDKGIVKFFFFGSILPYKGIETFVEAAQILENKTDKFIIYIYGRLNYNREQLQESIKNIKHMYIEDRFIDYREVFDIFDSNDVIIIPYRQVTQCGPLLIAYHQCKPVICSDLPGFKEYVDVGKSGLIFNNTPQGLAECMEKTINNPEAITRMSEYIKGNIKSRFSMASLAESYLKCFKEASQHALN